MADSGVDTSNESSDNPVFPRVSVEFEPPPIPLPPVVDAATGSCGGIRVPRPAVPPPHEPHEYIRKMRHVRNKRRDKLDEMLFARCMRLTKAACSNNTELAARMLDYGVDPNLQDDHQRSPLHFAACRGYVDVVRLLLARGADPNIRDAVGNTPLHLAACTSHLAVVAELLAAGADECSGDSEGRTPVQLAHGKLKHILERPVASDPEEMARLVAEVRGVLDMMLTYLKRHAPQPDAGRELESVCARLERVSTHDEVRSEVQCVLDSLKNLQLR